MSQKCILIYVGQSDMSYALASKRDYSLKREPQIGFAYLSAVLNSHDVETEIIDFTIKPFTVEELAKYVIEVAPVFVGFYAAAALKDRVLEYLHPLRKALPKIKILIGGPDIYDCENYLNAGANAFCMGEGELTIVDLLAYSRGQMNLKNINGIAYKENGKIHHTSPRSLIENLDELPVPDWDKFNLENYFDYHVFNMSTPYTSIMASRGCPFRCTFCISHKVWQHKYRSRSPAHVMKEIDYLVSELGVKFITFQDDIWSWNNEEWANSICGELASREYKLKWRCILHPLSFSKNREKMLSMMKSAGCVSITTGLQSASKSVLRNIHRSPKEPEALSELIRIANKLDILNNTAFIFGLPGETEETMEESIRYSLKIKPTFSAFYTLSVLPGSNIWQLKKEGKFQALAQELLNSKCREGARRFYSNPLVVWNIFKSIIKTNPKWLLMMLKHLKYLLEVSGLYKTRARSAG